MQVRTARKLGLTITAAAAVAALTAGCSSSGGSAANTSAVTLPSSSGSTANTTPSGGSSQAPTTGASGTPNDYLTAPTTLPVTTPLTKAAPTGLKIIFINTGLPQSLTILKGLQAAASVLGWSVSGVTYDSSNPATIPTSIDSAIAQKPDAIVLNGPLVAQYSAEIPKAIAANVPIIPTATSDKPQKGLYPVLDSGIENSHIARLVTDALLSDAQKTGTTPHILQLTVPAVAVVLGAEDEGVASELKAKCPSCTRDLLNINLPDVFNGKYTQQVVSYLQSHPNINYIVSDSGQLGDGLPQALQQAGLSKITNYGMSATNVQIKQLQAGSEGAWTVQPYQVWGWIIADQVARLKIGDPTDLWANEQLAYVVTAANAKGVNPDDQEFPAGYQDMFKKMWLK